MSKPWFKPKLYGYGAAPCTWEGVAATIVFAVVLAIAIIATRPFGRAVTIAVEVPLVVGFIVLARAKSSAPWRWRWGGDDER